MLTAGADPLRDEGDEYADRFKEAGVPVTYKHFPGQFHGFFTMGKFLPQANVAAQRHRRLAEGAELTRPRRAAQRLRRLAEGADEGAAHPLRIAKSGQFRDALDRFAGGLHALPRHLDP